MTLMKTMGVFVFYIGRGFLFSVSDIVNVICSFVVAV